VVRCHSCAVPGGTRSAIPDIAKGGRGPTIHAGSARPGGLPADQGIMFGFACDETPELMPACRSAWRTRPGKKLWPRCDKRTSCLSLPDGKTQVSVVYENDRPVAIDTA